MNRCHGALLWDRALVGRLCGVGCGRDRHWRPRRSSARRAACEVEPGAGGGRLEDYGMSRAGWDFVSWQRLQWSPGSDSFAENRCERSGSYALHFSFCGSQAAGEELKHTFGMCIVTVCLRPLLDPFDQLGGLVGLGSRLASTFNRSLRFRHRRLVTAKAPAADACRG
jgi:hypothetical protein